MFRTDVKVGRAYTPSPSMAPEQNTLDYVVKAYWMERMDTDVKKFCIACVDLRRIQQVFRKLNTRATYQEIEAKLQEITAALQENAPTRQENEAIMKQLMEQLAAYEAYQNEIQELRHLAEDMLRQAEQLLAKIQASMQSSEHDSEDDFEEFMANLDRKRAAKIRKERHNLLVLILAFLNQLKVRK